MSLFKNLAVVALIASSPFVLSAKSQCDLSNRCSDCSINEWQHLVNVNINQLQKFQAQIKKVRSIHGGTMKMQYKAKRIEKMVDEQKLLVKNLHRIFKCIVKKTGVNERDYS